MPDVPTDPNNYDKTQWRYNPSNAAFGASPWSRIKPVEPEKSAVLDTLQAIPSGMVKAGGAAADLISDVGGNALKNLALIGTGDGPEFRKLVEEQPDIVQQAEEQTPTVSKSIEESNPYLFQRTTSVGHFTEGLTQFASGAVMVEGAGIVAAPVTGALGVGRGLMALRTAMGASKAATATARLTGLAAAGSASSFIAFPANKSIIESFQQAATQSATENFPGAEAYLSSGHVDHPILARLKSVAEGGILNILLAGTGSVLKAGLGHEIQAARMSAQMSTDSLKFLHESLLATREGNVEKAAEAAGKSIESAQVAQDIVEAVRTDKPADIQQVLDGVAQKMGQPDVSRPANDTVRAQAADYMQKAGLPYEPKPGQVVDLNTDNSKKIADAYAAMKHDPTNPEVVASYEALAKETQAQYQHLTDQGVTFVPWAGKGEPYADSAAMMKDVAENKRLYFFKTIQQEGEKSFGETAGGGAADNPLLKSTGITIPDSEGKPHDMTVNDIFRAVHDYFGHAKEGHQFGPKGEENAWAVHSQMYSDAARPAMTTETRGQNSWVNFNEKMRRPDGSIPVKGDPDFIPLKERPFAEQKIGLLPKEFVAHPDEVAAAAAKAATAETPEEAAKGLKGIVSDFVGGINYSHHPVDEAAQGVLRDIEKKAEGIFGKLLGDRSGPSLRSDADTVARVTEFMKNNDMASADVIEQVAKDASELGRALDQRGITTTVVGAMMQDRFSTQLSDLIKGGLAPEVALEAVGPLFNSVVNLTVGLADLSAGVARTLRIRGQLNKIAEATGAPGKMSTVADTVEGLAAVERAASEAQATSAVSDALSGAKPAPATPPGQSAANAAPGAANNTQAQQQLPLWVRGLPAHLQNPAGVQLGMANPVIRRLGLTNAALQGLVPGMTPQGAVQILGQAARAGGLGGPVGQAMQRVLRTLSAANVTDRMRRTVQSTLLLGIKTIERNYLSNQGNLLTKDVEAAIGKTVMSAAQTVGNAVRGTLAIGNRSTGTDVSGLVASAIKPFFAVQEQTDLLHFALLQADGWFYHFTGQPATGARIRASATSQPGGGVAKAALESFASGGASTLGEGSAAVAAKNGSMGIFDHLASAGTTMSAAVDEMFKQSAYRSRVREEALAEVLRQRGVRGAVNPGFLGDISKATDALMNMAFEADGSHKVGFSIAERAWQYAKEVSFQDQGDISTRVAKWVGNMPYLGWTVAPFTSTPANIIRQTMYHLPGFNLLSKTYRQRLGVAGNRGAYAGDHDAMARAIGETVTGAALAGLVWNLACSGTITGGNPPNKGAKDIRYQAGATPYSLKQTDDKGNVTYLPLNTIEPLGSVIGIQADIALLISRKQELDPITADDLLSLGVQIGTGVVRDKSYFRGVDNLLTLIGGPKADDGKSLDSLNRASSKYLANVATMFVPPLVGEVGDMAAGQYAYQKEVYGFMDQVKSKLPGLNEVPALNILGEPMVAAPGLRAYTSDGTRLTIPESVRRATDVAFYSNRATNDPVMLELDRLMFGLGAVTPRVGNLDLRDITRKLPDGSEQSAFGRLKELVASTQTHIDPDNLPASVRETPLGTSLDQMHGTIREKLTKLFELQSYKDLPYPTHEDPNNPRVQIVKAIISGHRKAAMTIVSSEFSEIIKQKIASQIDSAYPQAGTNADMKQRIQPRANPEVGAKRDDLKSRVESVLDKLK